MGSVQRGSEELRAGRSALVRWGVDGGSAIDTPCAVRCLPTPSVARAADISVTVAERCVRWRRDRCGVADVAAAGVEDTPGGHSGQTVCAVLSRTVLLLGQWGDFKAFAVVVVRSDFIVLAVGVGVTISLAE